MSVPMSSDEIVDDLLERIALGEYPPGARLPSYRELAVLYGVGVTTMSTVIRLLRARGAVYGVAGRGVFVAED